jgi:hypothetical protein
VAARTRAPPRAIGSGHPAPQALLLYVSRLLFVQAGNGSSLYLLHRHPHLRWHLTPTCVGT